MPRRKCGHLRKAIPPPRPENQCPNCKQGLFCYAHGKTRKQTITEITVAVKIVHEKDEDVGKEWKKRASELLDGLITDNEDVVEIKKEVSVKNRTRYVKP